MKDGIQEAESQVIGQDLELEWDVLKKTPGTGNTNQRRQSRQASSLPPTGGFTISRYDTSSKGRFENFNAEILKIIFSSAMKKGTWICKVYIGDEKLPSHRGCKRFFFVAQL